MANMNPFNAPVLGPSSPVIKEYDPFQGGLTATPTPAPSIFDPESATPPSGSPSGVAGKKIGGRPGRPVPGSTTQFHAMQMKETDMSRREAELAQRERLVAQREQHVAEMRPNNWPPFLPLVFHDIDHDIPFDKRATIKQLYFCWCITAFCLLWNWLCIFAMWLSGVNEPGIGEVFLASAYLGCGVPGSWLIWYFTLYNGYRKSKSTAYPIFLFAFMGHIIFAFVIALGIKGFASAGFLTMLNIFGRKEVISGITLLIGTCCWVFCASFSAFLWKRIYLEFQSTLS